MALTVDLTNLPSGVLVLLEEANSILDATPDNLWWNMTPVEVVEFAFPDWTVVEAVESQPYQSVRFPRVLLRHRVDAGRWFLIYASGHELLPGRGSTMGQFFRFKGGYGAGSYATGTSDEVLARVRKQVHVSAREPLEPWLLAHLNVEA